MERYPSGSRGPSAKGLDCVKRCEGSNPSLSAMRLTKRMVRWTVLFLCLICVVNRRIMMYGVVISFYNV